MHTVPATLNFPPAHTDTTAATAAQDATVNGFAEPLATNGLDVTRHPSLLRTRQEARRSLELQNGSGSTRESQERGLTVVSRRARPVTPSAHHVERTSREASTSEHFTATASFAAIHFTPLH